MVELHYKSLDKAIAKVLLMKFSGNSIKTHKGSEKWPLFASITLNNNNGVLTDL